METILRHIKTHIEDLDGSTVSFEVLCAFVHFMLLQPF
jgi:hypothetical protein